MFSIAMSSTSMCTCTAIQFCSDRFIVYRSWNIIQPSDNTKNGTCTWLNPIFMVYHDGELQSMNVFNVTGHMWLWDMTRWHKHSNLHYISLKC